MTTSPDIRDDNTYPDSAAIASRVRREQGDLRWKDRELALASGISRRTLNRKLTPGAVVEFSVEEVIALAHALKVDWVWLMSGKGPRQASEHEGSPTYSLLAESNPANPLPIQGKRHLRLVTEMPLTG